MNINEQQFLVVWNSKRCKEQKENYYFFTQLTIQYRTSFILKCIELEVKVVVIQRETETYYKALYCFYLQKLCQCFVGAYLQLNTSLGLHYSKSFSCCNKQQQSNLKLQRETQPNCIVFFFFSLVCYRACFIVRYFLFKNENLILSQTLQNTQFYQFKMLNLLAYLYQYRNVYRNFCSRIII